MLLLNHQLKTIKCTDLSATVRKEGREAGTKVLAPLSSCDNSVTHIQHHFAHKQLRIRICHFLLRYIFKATNSFARPLPFAFFLVRLFSLLELITAYS